MLSPENGTRLRALVDFKITALVHWNAPMTSGARCSVKRGTIFHVYLSADPSAGIIRATLEDRKLEATFVGKKDYASSSYAGLSFLFDARDIGRQLEWL
ncbi:MAG: hypothetical protein ACHQWU_02815 [Gemmatimonadales bacterium]